MRKVITRLPLGLVPLCAFMLCLFLTANGETAKDVTGLRKGHSISPSSRLLSPRELVVAVGDTDMGAGGGSGGTATPHSYCYQALQMCVAECNSIFGGPFPPSWLMSGGCIMGCSSAYLWCTYFR